MYKEYILGDATAIDTLTPRRMKRLHKTVPCIRLWTERFINILITNHMQVSDFIEVYHEYLVGDINPMVQLRVLPNKIINNKALSSKYIETLLYTTFKRNVTDMYLTLEVQDSPASM